MKTSRSFMDNSIFRPLLLWTCVIISLIFSGAYASENTKRLLIINSYGEGAPWAQQVYTPILQELSSHNNISADVVHLNNTTIHGEKDFDNMEAGLFERFAARHPDYVVLVGNFSFTLRDRIVKEWGNVPMLLIAMSDKFAPKDFYYTRTTEDDSVCNTKMTPLADIRKDYNFTLVYAPNLYRETVDMMIHMFPSMKKIVFLGDALYINRHLSHEIRSYVNKKYPDLDFEWLMGSERNGKYLQNYLNDSDLNTGLLFSTWFFERTTIHGYPQLIAGEARLIESSHRPVFGLRYAYMSYGLLGGCFVSPDRQWQYIHSALNEMLAGKDMHDVPFREVRKKEIIVNYRVLTRDGLSERICPEGTVFINKPKTAWELYHAYFIAILVIIFAVLCVAGINILSQRRQIAMLRSRNRLIESMPIAYSQASVVYDSQGEVTDICYHNGNKSFMNLISANHIDSDENKLFEKSFLANIVKKLISSRNETVRFSHNFTKTDTWYDFLISVDKSDKRIVKEVNVFALDMTDSRKKETMLIEAREKAMESDKLKMAFLANMSHEIRTPLNAIVGFSHLLCGTEDRARRERFVALIDTNNQLLLKLIEDVLDVAKIESNSLEFKMRDTDLNIVMRNVESTMRLKMPQGVAFNCVLGAPECNIVTDPDRLMQVLVNLLTNAIKFTTHGSITLGYEPYEEEIYLYVRDTGKGISPEHISKLFNRFVKLDAFAQGNGLGLSISKGIVEKLGGQIGAESAGEGRGSLFWFTISRRLRKR